MYRLLTIVIALVAMIVALAPNTAAPSAAEPASAAQEFVSRDGAGFTLGGQPFRFGGTNNYYLHYKSELMVDDVFADAEAMGLAVIRAWSSLECGGDKPNSAGGCSQGDDLWMQRWSDEANGPEYNTGAGGLQKLDYLLAKANEHGIKVILPLVNNWPDFGGMDQYVTWHGLQYHDQFYTDEGIRQNYRDWAATLVNRTNSITGVQYKNDPAIFAWELANEPRCINASLPPSGTCTADTLTSWADDMSGYLKSIDPNHMVSVGDEGFFDGAGCGSGAWPCNVTDGVDNERLTALPNVDFGTFHLYPTHWNQSNEWGTTWIAEHTEIGERIGKPMILEEFGITDQGARPQVYNEWLDTLRDGGGDGFAFWILTGVQDDGSLYPDYDGFRVTYPSTDATVLAEQAARFRPQPVSQSLRGHASARGFLIGSAVATGPLGSEPAYRDTLNREFNAVTAENAMKWDATEPNQGQFNFGGADQIMDSAAANGQTVHGHTLVWHNQTPGWVQNLDAAAMRAAMENHISTVVGRYAGRIASWDVVNEVFDDNGNLRNSFWYQRLGESYIADAFRYARAADPDTTLCINDYNVEGINAKSTAMYDLVSRLRGQGVPIDCVGIQGHLAIQYGFPNDLRQNIERFAALGVDVKITELDVRMELPADATKLATQATYYRNVIDACLAVARCTGLTVWGFTDKYSWVPGTFPGQGAALPYDENYQAKPAYQALHDALAS